VLPTITACYHIGRVSNILVTFGNPGVQIAPRYCSITRALPEPHPSKCNSYNPLPPRYKPVTVTFAMSAAARGDELGNITACYKRVSRGTVMDELVTYR
jgi:hypothetical protein